MATKLTRAAELTLVEETFRPLYVSSVKASALVGDSDGRLNLSRVSSTALIVTESADGSAGTKVSRVSELTLIAEGGAPSQVTQAAQPTLIVTEPAPPKEIASLTAISEITLIEEGGAPNHLSSTSNLLLLQTEGPNSTASLTQIQSATIVADLFRGIVGISTVGSHTCLLTEAPSRDPERLKCATTFTAHLRTYSNPVGLMSNVVAQDVNGFVVQSDNRPDPRTMISPASIQMAASYTAIQQEMIDPLNGRSWTPNWQVTTSAVVTLAMRNPLAVTAPYLLSHVAASTAQKADYVNASTLTSQENVNAVNVLALHLANYNIPGQSEKKTHAYKVESLHANASYKDPRDIGFTPFFKSPQAITTTAHESYFESPETFSSQEAVGSIKIESATQGRLVVDPTLFSSMIDYTVVRADFAHEVEYKDPEGEHPTANVYGIGVTAAISSPNYNIFPRSEVNSYHAEVEVACKSSYRYPPLIRESHLVPAVLICSAAVAEYDKPKNTPKRRIVTATKTQN